MAVARTGWDQVGSVRGRRECEARLCKHIGGWVLRAGMGGGMGVGIWQAIRKHMQMHEARDIPRVEVLDEQASRRVCGATRREAGKRKAPQRCREWQ
jgi:hypothetical protein